jgi:hypothetical protein
MSAVRFIIQSPFIPYQKVDNRNGLGGTYNAVAVRAADKALQFLESVLFWIYLKNNFICLLLKRFI